MVKARTRAAGGRPVCASSVLSQLIAAQTNSNSKAADSSKAHEAPATVCASATYLQGKALGAGLASTFKSTIDHHIFS